MPGSSPSSRPLCVFTVAALIVSAGPLGAGIGRWTLVGPQLEEGGRVLAVAVDPRSPDTVYAAVHDAGVFRSEDGGGTWHIASGHPAAPLDSIFGLVADPWAPDALFAFGRRGVFHSADGGATWQARGQGLPPLGPDPEPLVRALSPDPETPGRLLALAVQERQVSNGSEQRGSLYHSTDGGRSWSLWSQAVRFSSLHRDPFSPRTLYAVASVGSGASLTVFKSGDEGRTWQPASRGLPEAGLGALAIDPHIPGRLWASSGGRVLRSEDGAGGWVEVAELPLGVGQLWTTSRPGTLYGVSRNVLIRSDDGGVSWRNFDPRLPDDAFSILALAVDPRSPDTLYAGVQQVPTGQGADGVFKSTDGGESWRRRVRGMGAPVGVLDLEVDPGGDPALYLTSRLFGLFKSPDGGRIWQPLEPGLREGSWIADLALSPRQPESLWALVAEDVGPSRMLRSTDAGATWAEVPGLCPLAADLGGTVRLDPFDPAVIYASGGALCRSSDGGETWTELLSGIVLSMAVSPAAPGLIFAGGTDQLFPPGPSRPQARLYRSLDGGETFGTIGEGLRERLGAVDWVTPDPLSPEVIYVSGRLSSGFGTPDGGGTWTPVDAFGGFAPLSLLVDPEDPDIRYAGNPLGVWKSADGGESWFPLSRGLITPDVSRLHLVPSTPRTLYAGTPGGVFAFTEAASSCTADATHLCLNRGRFEVQAEWVTDQGTRGLAQAVGLTEDTGYFWFFEPDNVELVVKVLDACAPAGRFWVFAGGLTNVEVEITVTDTAAGAVKVYRNLQGTPFQPIQDTAAFATCP